MLELLLLFDACVVWLAFEAHVLVLLLFDTCVVSPSLASQIFSDFFGFFAKDDTDLTFNRRCAQESSSRLFGMVAPLVLLPLASPR